jgi:hypothetical protein
MIDEIVKTFAEQTIADIKSRIPNVSGSMANSLEWSGAYYLFNSKVFYSFRNRA